MTSGMIGLGNMGGRIARRIRDAGLPVRGFDVERGQAAAAGIETAASIASVAAPSTSCSSRCPTAPRSSRSCSATAGCSDRSRAGRSSSTFAPPRRPRASGSTPPCRAGRRVRRRRHLGRRRRGREGNAHAHGGRRRGCARTTRPILETFSTGVYHMGAPGRGHVAKLLNNFLNGISLAATAEVMVAAKRAGLDLAQFLDVVNHSSGVNFATLNRFPRIVEGDYLEGGLDERADGEGHPPLPRAPAGDRVTSLTGAACLGAFDLAGGARLRRPDQQSRRRRDRRRRRRRPRPAGSEENQ